GPPSEGVGVPSRLVSFCLRAEARSLSPSGRKPRPLSPIAVRIHSVDFSSRLSRSGEAMFDDFIITLDWLGVVVFAITGALAASRNQMDLIGFALLGIVTGIGGGTLR